jgi:hypothetical protein
VPSRLISRRILHCHYVEKWRVATGHDEGWQLGATRGH